MAEQGLADRTTITGNVNNVHEFLQCADIFVFPSEYEGFGLSILEAMSVGLPMVSTRVGVANEIPTEPPAALLVAPNAHADFCRQLARVMDEPDLRAQLAQNATEFVKSRFAMNTVARRHIELFRRLTKGTSE
jgi:glycosyltransferase involved in cell wall biosynthesis